MNPKQPYSCSGLGHFRASFRKGPTHTHTHTPAANNVSLVLARGELPFTSEHHSLPYAEGLSSECPEIGTLLKHKSPERVCLTFCYNQSAQENTHTHTHTHTRKQWYQFQSGNILQNMSGGWERMWHFQGVCCRMATKPKRLLIWLSQSTSQCSVAPPTESSLDQPEYKLFLTC